MISVILYGRPGRVGTYSDVRTSLKLIADALTRPGVIKEDGHGPTCEGSPTLTATLGAWPSRYLARKERKKGGKKEENINRLRGADNRRYRRGIPGELLY